MTANDDLITGALRLLRVIRPGQGASPSQLAVGLASLNELLDGWSTERLTIYQIPDLTFPLVSGQQVYEIGPGAADFDTPRPVRIERAVVITQVGSDQPLRLPMSVLNLDRWADIPVRNISSTLPRQAYYLRTWPLGAISIWPVPNAPAEIELYPWQALTQIEDPTAQFTLPEGYQRALRYNLAVALAPEFGADPSALVIGGAMEAKANIKRNNYQPQELACDSGLGPQDGGAYNWLTDSVR